MSVPPSTPDNSPTTELGRNLLPIASAVGLVLTALLPLLAMFGVRLPDTVPDVVTRLIGALLFLFTLLYSRLRTTPLVDPRNAVGQPLVPATRITRPGDGSTLRRDPGTDPS